MNLTNYVGESALFAAAELGKHWIVRLLLDNGANFDTCNTNGRTALMAAMLVGSVPTVKLLLAAGARTDVQDSYGNCILHFGLREGCMLYAVASGSVDVNCRNDQFCTPCHKQVFNIESLKFLIAAGGDYNASDRLRISPATIAQSWQLDDVCLLLADLNKFARVAAVGGKKRQQLCRKVAWLSECRAQIAAARVDLALMRFKITLPRILTLCFALQALSLITSFQCILNGMLSSQ